MKTQVKVLIAEDSAHMRAILKEILLRRGYSVAGEAENGSRAVFLYGELKPDLVVMDIAMPEMDGIDALKAIKMSDPKAKVVMISSMGQQNQVIEALRAGTSGFFIKPMQAEIVVEELENALK